MGLSYEIKQFVKENPLDAENREDLLNWTCDQFGINSDEQVNEIYDLIRKLHPFMEK